MIPSAIHHDPRPAYVKKLLKRIPMTQAEIASVLGVTDRAIRHWLNGRSEIPYTAQFALEVLAEYEDE